MPESNANVPKKIKANGVYRQDQMNLTREDFRRFVDIEATVDDGDEDEDEDDTDRGTSAEISY
jgi:hypothetical protein